MIVITSRGVADLIQSLGAVKGDVARAARESVGAEANRLRERLIDLATAETGLSRTLLQQRTSIQVSAGDGQWSATIRPSAASIPVPDYRWRHQATGHPTRHRIVIDWPGGGKIAAGFVNPLGRYQAPLTTRRKGYKLAVALGPSVAALFARLFAASEQRSALDDLARQFQARLTIIKSRG